LFQNLAGSPLKQDKKFDSTKFTGELKNVSNSIIKFMIMIQSNQDMIDKYSRSLNDLLNFDSMDQIDFESIKISANYNNILMNIKCMNDQLRPFFEYKNYGWTVDAI
jgi:hypothetical protein